MQSGANSMSTQKAVRSRDNLKALILFFIFCGILTCTQASANVVKNMTASRHAVMKNKLFYFFTIIESESKAAKALKKNKALREISKAQLDRTRKSLDHCKSGKCIAASIQWSDEEIKAAGTELLKSLKNEKTRNKIVEKLKESGHYNLYHHLIDTAFIRTVWENNAHGINRIFSVYLGGTPPKRYAPIDSISYNQDDPVFVEMVNTALTAEATKMKNGSTPFFKFPLEASLTVLYINGRDEAARYEPLTAGYYNALAFEQAKHTDWSAYKYTVLLVPGFGPEKEGVRLHEKGIARCKMAAERFKKGMAPFIIVSGGHVYPFRTPICEAIEMRRYLTEELDIPREAIIIEPHARHTTTNIRNATRLLYKFDMPDTKLGLVVTDSAQTEMIKNLAPRCIRELGYVPYEKVNVLNDNEVEFVPSMQAFQINLEDVLDP